MRKAVEIKNLSFSYSDGKKVLDDFSLDIHEGETVGIIGPNGAGKTTLLLHLSGVFGKDLAIKIFDILIKKENLFEIRKKIGLLFQNPDDQLFMITVFDDIAFGLLNLGLSKEEIVHRAEKYLEAVSLPGYGDRISHHLSYGEKKRVALASVLAMEPEILVLDEPTANLDPTTCREFVDLLKNFNHTKIIAGHNMYVIREICDKVVILNKGKKIIEGTPKEIFDNEPLLLQNRLI